MHLTPMNAGIMLALVLLIVIIWFFLVKPWLRRWRNGLVLIESSFTMENLDQLRKAGTITTEEFKILRQDLLKSTIKEHKAEKSNSRSDYPPADLDGRCVNKKITEIPEGDAFDNEETQ